MYLAKEKIIVFRSKKWQNKGINSVNLFFLYLHTAQKKEVHIHYLIYNK